ncbi:MAG: glycerol-3-phosphate 1-O-acyltransferase PlsY [Endomicrobia bacterium]|nr:glycerol-3-phosphate 1-O-acyltransferase PlsY [Endomicrobiia bacterium]
MKLLIYLIISYFIGSFPTAYILVKTLKGKDIRNMGSGNPGATNVARTSGAFLGIVTLIIDFLKGFLPIYIARKIGLEEKILIMLFTVLGHTNSIFLKFKGGKGVATFFGAVLGLSTKIFFIELFIFLLVFLITHIVSISSLISALFFTIFILFFKEIQNSLLNITISIIISLIIIIRHKENITRILNKQEKKFF